jgi:hypothetical protein
VKRPTVYLDRALASAIERYTADGAPAGALGRVLLEWALALMDEAPALPDDEAQALLAIAREWRPRARNATGEPRVQVEVENLPTAILDEAAFAGVDDATAHRLAERIAALDPIARLGLILRLAWGCEALDLTPGPGRRPQSFEDALRLARLAEG